MQAGHNDNDNADVEDPAAEHIRLWCTTHRLLNDRGFQMNGARNRPLLLPFDELRPECHGPYLVYHHKSFSYMNKEFSGYEVKYICEAGDAEHVKCYQVGPYSLMIEMPSVMFFQRNANLWKKSALALDAAQPCEQNKVYIEESFRKQRALVKALHDNRHRKKIHWVIQFPNVLKIDDFSNTKPILRKHTVDMASKFKSKDDGNTYPTAGTELTWRVCYGDITELGVNDSAPLRNIARSPPVTEEGKTEESTAAQSTIMQDWFS